jgi:PIN domain nuclease of toxin-antitoxin system
MRLLLDTPTFLWLDGSPEQLSPAALAACQDPTNELYLSVVSASEIQTAPQINRLHLDVLLEEMMQGQQTANDLKILSVGLHYVYILRQLPLHHHDLFDQLLIAQAKAEQMRLVSADSQFAPYLVDVLW